MIQKPILYENDGRLFLIKPVTDLAQQKDWMNWVESNPLNKDIIAIKEDGNKVTVTINEYQYIKSGNEFYIVTLIDDASEEDAKENFDLIKTFYPIVHASSDSLVYRVATTSQETEEGNLPGGNAIAAVKEALGGTLPA